MDPNPKSFPILSYVMARLPSFSSPRRGGTSSPSTAAVFDIEQPPQSPSPKTPSSPSEPYFDLKERMPHLTDPKLISEMRSAVADVAQTRSVLKKLGGRPDHESVDTAKAKLVEIESKLAEELDEISLTPASGAANDDNSPKKVAEREREMYMAVIKLDEMHEAYGKLLAEAETRLEKIYESAVAGRAGAGAAAEEDDRPAVVLEVNEEVVRILQEASVKEVERIDLSDRQLRFLPEAFGKISTLVALNLSSNQLQVIPDSIAGLEKLEQLSVSSNLLETLPESIGLLLNLKVLDVSSNKLVALPDSICLCRSLLELEASFNKLTYLPTNIGELVNLRRLSVQLNKIRSLPTSIGDMTSLRILDVHFNELQGLPLSFGRLTKLELLNLGSNFNDLTQLPDTFGDLTNLKELDLSNNQIHELPITFSRLENLVKLNLDGNPIVVPPKEVLNKGVEAVRKFMVQRWLDVLTEEEDKSNHDEDDQSPMAWLNRSTSWLKESVAVVSESVSEYMGAKGKTNQDPCLNQQY